MELCETEVRLAKKLAQHDRAGEGEATLEPGQPPFLKLTVHEPWVHVYLLEHPHLPSGCLGLGSAHTLQQDVWKLVTKRVSLWAAGMLVSLSFFLQFLIRILKAYLKRISRVLY